VDRPGRYSRAFGARIAGPRRPSRAPYLRGR
jgi:hypothetical protein